MKKVVLAYSGGLDTTCCLRWLRDRGFEVICFSADLGSEFSPEDIRTRAGQGGAVNTYVMDLKKEFAQEYVLPSLSAGAVYQGKYLLSTALGRPLIAKYLTEIARKEGAGYLAHGCTGKGNDQVRIEVNAHLLAPELKIIAPLREWELTSREAEIEYAKKHGLTHDASAEKIYSIDQNLWGISVEGGILEDPGQDVPLNSYYQVNPPEKTPDTLQDVEISFEEGVPVRLNGQPISFIGCVQELNEIGARHGIGRTDLIEDRVVGIKSREIYEAPAAWILHTALRELEHMTLDRETLAFKSFVAEKYAQLVYQGLWFSPLKTGLDEFAKSLRPRITGTIRLGLFRGLITVRRRFAPHALYQKEIATYGEGSSFDPSHAEGFIRLWEMPFIRKENT
ncbi:MAG: argininosuccinate synthase [Candidatus Omnitrophica bacterium]|nr:argininosuccinate synthase [Candidatus Omnitrophota bacterium]